MPREDISIRRFGGMITNPQQEDVPDFASAWNQNVDPTFQGQLRGIKDNGAAYQANGNVEIPDVYESDWLNYNRPDKILTVSTHGHPENPIEIVTAASHNLVTGDKVIITGGDPVAMNGTWRITVTEATKFTIPVTSTGNYVSGGSVAYTGGDKWDLIYADKEDNDVTAIEDFYNGAESYRTFNDIVTSVVGTANCIKTFNNQCLIGLGKAVGAYPYIVHRLINNKSFFNGAETALAGLYAHYGRCYNQSSTTGLVTVVSGTLSGAVAGYFQTGVLYSWKVSLTFDGLQESELSSAGVDTATSTDDSCAVLLRATDAANAGIFEAALWDKRITAVNVYRAESSDGNSENLGLHRLVKTIDIDDTGWSVNGNHYELTYTDTGGYPGGGQTYEEQTGLAETLEFTWVNYNINEVGGGYHWVTQGTLPDTALSTDTDWNRYIFRSQKFRPNMFNWAYDFVILPEIPVDFKYYNDTLYAFTKNKIYPINPELLIVGDPFEGVGVSARGGIKVTEYGMFFCNINGAYRLFNNQVTTISNPIKTTMNTTKTNESWEAFAKDALLSPGIIGRIIVGYLADKRCILFIGQAPSASTTLAFIYYLPTEEWYIWTLDAEPLDANSGLVTGKDGELYWSGTTTLNKLLGASATWLDHDWLSKEFTLGKPSQNKLWKKIIWDSTGTVVVKRGVNGTYPATSVTNNTYFNDYQKTQQILLDCTTNATTDSLDILVRELIGVR